MDKDMYYFDDCYAGDVCDILSMPSGRYYHDKVDVDEVTFYFVSKKKLTKKEMVDIVNDEN